MSEKRFKKMDTIIDPFPILDTVEELGYNCTDTLDLLVDLLNEQESTIQSLKEENERLKEKLNVTALELVDEAISMGKAVEISEMDYHEFLEYRQKKGKAMELQR